MELETNDRHEARLRYKIARLSARRRLLFKRASNPHHRTFTQRRLLMEREARTLRLSLERLRRQNGVQHIHDRYESGATSNVTNYIDNGGRQAGIEDSHIPDNVRDNGGRQIPLTNVAHREDTLLERQHDVTDCHSFGGRKAICTHCKALMWIEERVKGSSLSQPRFNLCCQSGQVSLPYLPSTPTYLKSLLADQQFRDKIRMYNSLLAFTSIGARIDNTVNDGRGPYVFRISGSLYHRIGSLIPEPGNMPKFAQLYIYDTDNELTNRVNAIEGSSISPLILQGLRNMLGSVNPYVAVFRNASTMLREQGQVQNMRIKLICAREGKQYLKPTSNEVAALLVGDGTESFGHRDVILQTTNGTLQTIDETHPSYMPLQYPLLFPYGTDGWTLGIPKMVGSSRSQTTVTLRQFLAFRIQDRRDDGDNFVEGDTLIEGGRLLQQFDVDGYASMEKNRLLYVKRNQGKLRTDLYRELQDEVTVGDVNTKAIGRRYILPSSFTRGPRNMVLHYQDAMAIVRVMGPPDFFITFTCHPNWSEIVTELPTRAGRRVEDRPDIVARVFKLKFKEFIRDFKERHKYGKVIADLYVIEFQKRGLPHGHVLFTMAAEDKPTCPEDIDKFISAEIPDKETDPKAFEIIVKNMIHGPCGPCLVDGKCSKNYPKKFYNETTFDGNGFVQYSRRRNKEPIVVNGREIDNRWVVPYNRDLCVKYNAHINVERVAVRSVVKYLYKYVYKGHDRASVVIEENGAQSNNDGQPPRKVDEIQQYLDCRYVSAIEACWRIFEFDLQHQYPSAGLLQFHLPGEQFVVFHDDDELHDVIEQPRLQETMLTMWFQANKDFPQANQYTYLEFPIYFVWDRQLRRWKPRQQRLSLGRLPYIHPNSGERYYLRLLLTKVCGATSYEDIRTVRGVVHPSFRSACHALGLLDDHNEWHAALSEAST